MTTPTPTSPLPAPSGTPAAGAAPGSAPAATPLPPARLRNGELRRQVAQYLADHAGRQFTACELANVLGRSSGAVGNALGVLAGRGEAERATVTPARYRATATTAAAAAAAAVTVSPRRTRSARPATPASATVPSSPAETALPPSAAVPVTRPNGQTYHPRLLSGQPDVVALRKLREAGVAALLYGPPGTGKTSVVEAAFGDLVTVPGDGDTTVADFVGEYTQTDDARYVFVHGPLVTAMREGRCLFIDDATLIPPTVLAVVYPAMDGRRHIVVKANGGEVVTAAPGFYIVAGTTSC